jgi:choline monooxygenase
MPLIDIDPDILLARTPPGSFYADAAAYAQIREQIFARSWQWIGVHNAVREPGSAFPFDLLEGLLDEPLLLTKAEDGLIRLMSNVCTHRGNLLVHKAGACKAIRCRYHGRRFDLGGKLQSAPGFEDCPDFPGPQDHLPTVPMAEWGPFLFANLHPQFSFGLWMSEIKNYLHWLPLQQFRLDSTRSREFTFDANWALYVENYLEGFHIPFVHKGLNAVIDIQQYETSLLEWGVLQKAIAKDDQIAFDLPPESPDFGKRIAAYYFWLFPNTMLNFYPWGLSLNVVKPLGINRTKVKFLTYVHQPQLLGTGCWRGSGNGRNGRRSRRFGRAKGCQGADVPTWTLFAESRAGVHHFHRLLFDLLS